MRPASIGTMAGVGKLLKQAQKMQRSIETLQAQLDAREIEVAAGGGAVKVKVSGSGKFLALSLDPEFLKEDPKLVSDTVLAAVQDAAKQAKEFNDSEMQKVTSAFQMPGIF
jgi:DNA-binding YbaB/EbfC family protein